MLYQIESEHFFLKMEPRVFEDELDYANNSDITIKNFIEFKALPKYTKRWWRIYKNLTKYCARKNKPKRKDIIQDESLAFAALSFHKAWNTDQTDFSALVFTR